MTDLVVRRLLIDMEAPIPRHWCAGDPFRTALFNALSMSFPVGEQFFIDSVRNGFKTLPAEKQERFRAEVQGFIGQEATHRRLHSLYNEHLERQGLVNDWAGRAQQRLKLLEGMDSRHLVAITAANEHFTAILADWLLSNPDLFGDEDPRLATLWLWHSAEESEHKSTAFDIYRALEGSESWRITWFRRITLIFLGDLLRQTLNNLRRDGDPVALAHLEERRIVPVRPARPYSRHLASLAQVPAPRLSSQPAGHRSGAALAGRTPRSVHAGGRVRLSAAPLGRRAVGAKYRACNSITSPIPPGPPLRAAPSRSSTRPTASLSMNCSAARPKTSTRRWARRAAAMTRFGAG